LAISEDHLTSAATEFGIYPSLRDRVVLVTGGASGIGEKIVEQFAGQGAKVVFLDILDEAAAQLVGRFGAGRDVSPAFLHCDLTDISAIQGCVQKIIAQFATVDVLVNNAANDDRHALEEVTSEYWDRSIAVNLKHQFFLSQAVIPFMKKAGRGSIVNLSSISWIIPATGLPVYVTAKAAIVGLSRTLARELGPDSIRVNCVLPGAIVTERQKRLWYTDAYQAEILSRQALKRMLLPEEVARLVLFLASDDSSAITGQIYVIDGGWV
jgi:NAD(P)-dependent dehydrogenase (short-subunit alcohol dehydrogenase family)